MALWPFGRKSKRHTIQVTGVEATDLQSSLTQESAIEPTLGRKPFKRQNRMSRGDGDSRWNPALVPSNRPISSLDRPSSLADHQNPPREHTLSRTASLLRRKPSQNNGPNKLRRRLSKRKANEIMREREIRMLSSTPIDIPHRQTLGNGDYVLEHRRRKTNDRRPDRYMSDISLSIRNSAASSASDASDTYTYKVNAFAALTPRPVVRYVEAPRLQTAKSTNPPVSRQDKERLATLTLSEEDLYYSRRRVNELADSLDAGALRELLDRDRRRREKKQIDDQEKLRRKLQERADAPQAQDEQRVEATQENESEVVQTEPPTVKTEQSIIEPEPIVADPPVIESEDIPMEDDTILEVDEPTSAPHENESCLTAGESKASHPARVSLESSRATGNVEESSIRGPRFPRPQISRTTLSPSHSSIQHGLNSPTHSTIHGPGSTSDISRGIDSRRSSDTSARRGNTITSLFRRGSSRIKRRYKERFQDASPEVPNASHESFYKIPTQSSTPLAINIPQRILIPSEPIHRSQSKFTEHFDEPLSPTDLRLQSPDIPKQVPESSLETGEISSHRPSPTPGVDIQNPNRSHHRSWTSDLMDMEADNVPLSQSLASIDSEGSWMSGQFFKRMSQTSPTSPVRSSLNPLGCNSADIQDTLEDIEDIDEPDMADSIIGGTELDEDDSENKPAERWHNEVGRRPVLVNPVCRPKSTQGMLRNFPTLTPITAEQAYIVAEPPSELQRVPSAKAEIGYAE